MEAIKSQISAKAERMSLLFEPVFFRLNNSSDKEDLQNLLDKNDDIVVFDELESHLRELIKINNPSRKIKSEEYPALIQQHLGDTDRYEYGVWVYFPWSKKLVHLLDEHEFVKVRTNRNKYKLTDKEQEFLKGKKIGIIGLSVGQSIALTTAMERICGEIRLADFDIVELSNLNRIRTGVQNLCLKKTVLAAREIYEIDPFLKVKVYNDGITNGNIDDFFSGGGNLDLLVEVCDGLDIKIQSRFKARSLGIPVLMDTNDRGMVDIERFDLEPERPILHGLAGDLDPDNIKDLTNEEKIPYILKMVGADTISKRLKASMMEVEQSINTWPQLASSVMLGGAITTDIARKVLLDQLSVSGRYYIDFDELIKDTETDIQDDYWSEKGCPPELQLSDLKTMAGEYSSSSTSESLTEDELTSIADAARLAPSGGNAQPWKFLYKDNKLFVFHDIHYSYSLLDFDHLGSYIGFGALLENVELRAAKLGIVISLELFPIEDKRLVMVLSFQRGVVNNRSEILEPVIGKRITDRSVVERKLLADSQKSELKSVISDIAGAELTFFDSEQEITLFADILTSAEKIRLLNPRGHYDTFVKELRFTEEQVKTTCDGLDVATLNMNNSDIAALQIAKDADAINFLYRQHMGEGFKKISGKAVMSAGAICVLNMDGDSQMHFLKGGRALERVWLRANSMNIAFQPISQIVFMLERYKKGGIQCFNDNELQELEQLKRKFDSILNFDNGRYPTFVFRLLHSEEPVVRSLRRPLDKLLFA
ncbi:MAG: Rv1355c family protein [Chitinophagales bacterium]|nr:Rv1355c family protein [Chitinophagaceae bacterium]MCB9065618.1 Rv1355c family protein [Chitinophagales bacterium]